VCSEAGAAGLQIARGGEADLHGLCLLERTNFDAEGEIIDSECLEFSALVEANPIGAKSAARLGRRSLLALSQARADAEASQRR
jgi:hypothetical protein